MAADRGDHPIRARVATAKLTAAERRIAEVITGSFPESALLSAAQIAEQAGVSASSVTRFATKLRYGNFYDLQEALRSEVRARLTTPSLRLDITAPRRSPAPSEFLAAAINADIENLRRSQQAVDPAVFGALVDHLAATRGRIFVAGSKKGYVAAHYFGMQLQQIQPGVVVLELGDHLADDLADLKASDTLVAFEPRRATNRLVELVAQFKSIRAPVAVVADEFPAGPLVIVDYLLTASTNGISIFDSYTALISIANALLAAIVSRNSGRVRERIKRIEGVNRALGTWYEESYE